MNNRNFKDDSDLRAQRYGYELKRKQLEKALENTRKIKRSAPIDYHLPFTDCTFLRIDTIELCINKKSFLEDIWYNLTPQKDSLGLYGSIYYEKRRNGFYIRINKCYTIAHHTLFNDVMYLIATYFRSRGYTPKKYKKSNKTIDVAYIENVKAKFKCPYNIRNETIKITELHLFTEITPKQYEAFKISDKYQNYLDDSQGNRTFYEHGLYSKATQRRNPIAKLENIYDISDEQGTAYKHEFRLGTYEVKQEFKNVKTAQQITYLFNINSIVEYLQHKRNETNGNINKGLDMKLRNYNIDNTLTKAIDTQSTLTVEQKREILALVRQELQPIYSSLDEHSKEITALKQQLNMLKYLSKKPQESLF